MPYGNGYPADGLEEHDGAAAADHCRRLLVLFWTFLILFLGVGIGLVRVHTSPDSRLTAEELTHIGQVELRVPRGEIRDRDDNLLAKDRRVNSLWADPRKIADPSVTACWLSAAFNVAEDDLRERLTARDAKGNPKKFVWVKRWLTEQDLEVYQNLDASQRAGLALKDELVRYYPEGELAAHILGYVNKDGQGAEGIELAYDKYLRCVPGKRTSRVDAKRVVMQSLTLEYVEEAGGENVHLTLDKGIQRALEQELDRGLIEYNAPRGMGMVMDPKTGAILAMACRPAYDPNRFNEVLVDQHKNRAVVDVFEPGSAFKIVTFAAALEHGLIDPDMRINCEGGIFNPYGHTIRDFHKLGVVPVTQAFAESSNIATIKIAAMLAPERMEMWVRRFGFGSKTSPDFPLESRGIVRPLSDWSRWSMSAIPIGQEVAVTMPQLARAFCVIANGGYLVEPYLVERVTDREGHVSFQHAETAAPRILSEQTASIMRELCHLVVLHGTGKPAMIPDYRVGGKTGTAQIARPDGKGFFTDKYTAIFAGFAPVADPRLCAVIIVQEPDIKLHYGGHVCGPLFRNVVRESLIRMNCPRDPVAPEEGAGRGGSDDLQPTVSVEEDDSDTVVARTESGLSLVAPGPNDMLDGLELMAPGPPSEATGPVLPDLAGLTKRQAKAHLDLLGLRWDARGAGRVIKQEPPPGTPLQDISVCRLVFSSQPVETSTYEVEPNSPSDRL